MTTSSLGRRTVVAKFGGELLEEPQRLQPVVAALGEAMRRANGQLDLVVVHGGGKEIDAALKVAGIPKQQVDGLRITDDATLDVVVAVLAGTVNTRFVAALTTAGVQAVGLTGADGACGLSDVAPPHQTVDGRSISLGRVGLPSADAGTGVLTALTAHGLVPVIACVGLARDGRLLNVNADTLAGFIAAQLRAQALVVCGTTAGVLDDTGATVPLLDRAGVDALIGNGTATAGMVAKLRACSQALAAGVSEVVIVDGRDGAALLAGIESRPTERSTRIVPATPRPTR